MEKLIELLEDKIREIKESKTETEELGVSEDTVNGYIKGINHAISVVKDYEIPKERLFYDIDSGETLTESKLRKLFFECEIHDLFNNVEDYLNDMLDLNYQLENVKLAKNGDIQEIIKRLGTCWQIPVKEIKY